MNDATQDETGGGLLDALIEGERATLASSPEAERRTWTRVASSVAMGAPLPVEPTSIAGPAASASWAAPWLKVVLALVFGSAVAVGGYGLLARDEAPAPAVDDVGDDVDVQHVGAATPGDAAPSLEPAAIPDPPPPLGADPAVPARPTTDPPTREIDAPSARAAPRPRSAAPTPPDLAEETRLLARARAHLRSGDPSAALAPLDEHARRFAHGQLAEDRMVLRAQALCEAGDVEAGHKQTAALQRAFPQSSHLPRVRRACD